jgi:hypothetical protein
MCLTHGVSRIVAQDSTRVFFGEGRLAHIGDRTECGAVILGGNWTVIAGSPSS